jgi:outer membrane protein assembly factor BamB
MSPRRLIGVGATVIVTAAITLLAASSSALADDWNTGTGGNSTRDGRSQYVGPSAPDLLWEGGLPAIVSQQAVIDGDVMVVSRIANFDIPTGTWIVAHNLYTGDILWQTRLPYDFPGSSWRSKTSAVRDGHVYATRAGNTNEDYLYALDVNDGNVIIWRSEALIDESTTESLAFAGNGDLIVGNFTSVMRINKDDGTTVWSTPRTCPTSSGAEAAVFGDRVYLWEASGAGPKVSAFDINTGDYLYSSAGIGGGLIQQLGLFVGPDGTIYAPRTQNNPVTDYFVALRDTGTALEEKWRQPMGYVPFASHAIGPDGTVYTYSPDLEVMRLDPETGDVLDVSFPLKDNSPRIAIDARGTVFVTNGGFDEGEFHSFNADLTERWTVPLYRVNLGGPAVGPGGIVIVCGVGDDVRAYKSCRADFDGDGAVSTVDLLRLLAAWGTPGGLEDIDESGVVDTADLLALLAAWGECPL